MVGCGFKITYKLRWLTTLHLHNYFFSHVFTPRFTLNYKCEQSIANLYIKGARPDLQIVSTAKYSQNICSTSSCLLERPYPDSSRPQLSPNSQNETHLDLRDGIVARKSSIGGLFVCSGLNILKIEKNSTDLLCFIFPFGVVGALFGGLNPPTPRGDGTASRPDTEPKNFYSQIGIHTNPSKCWSLAHQLFPCLSQTHTSP